MGYRTIDRWWSAWTNMRYVLPVCSKFPRRMHDAHTAKKLSGMKMSNHWDWEKNQEMDQVRVKVRKRISWSYVLLAIDLEHFLCWKKSAIAAENRNKPSTTAKCAFTIFVIIVWSPLMSRYAVTDTGNSTSLFLGAIFAKKGRRWEEVAVTARWGYAGSMKTSTKGSTAGYS